jgi:hypothetical protein
MPRHRLRTPFLVAAALLLAPRVATAQPPADGTPVEDDAPHSHDVVVTPSESEPGEESTVAHEPPEAEPDAAVVEVGAPAPVVQPAPPAPAGPVLQTVVAGVPIRVTGILHAGAIATQGVQSFGFANASAMTAALNPTFVADPNQGDLSFQIQQTRAGIIVGDEANFRGQLEVDFIHFDQSSPTVQAFPRVRIAVLEWQFAEGQRVFLGQTWDLFGGARAPLLSHSFNIVGSLFQAGNIGFMRHQLGWLGTFGDLQIALAAGLQGANAGPTFNNIEESLTPTGAARVMLSLGPNGVIGVSGIATALRFTGAGGEERRLALGGEVFGDLTFGPLNLHAEVYLSQNLANLGALNLSQGRYGTDITDVGGYVSGKLTFGQHSISAMFGAAAVLNPDDVIPAYTSMTPGIGVGTPSGALGPGIRYNMSAHVGYWFSPIPGLSIILEPYVYVTDHAMLAEDVARYSSERISFGGQLGGMFSF